MRVFISWSGSSSRRVAEALRDWLPEVLQTVEPWLSAEDIPIGASWQREITASLEDSDAGIICLTRENLRAPWISFEAGALSRLHALVCPYLFDLNLSELEAPLAQFQATKADHEGTLALLKILNSTASTRVSDRILERSFERHWPFLEARLAQIEISASARDSTPSLDKRIDEILFVVRDIAAKTRFVEAPMRRPRPPAGSLPRVFIGSSTEGLEIAENIQLGLERSAECTLWNQSTFAVGQTAIESIVDVTTDFDFAVLVLTPDDLTSKRGAESHAPRDNMLFELGLFTGALGRARTFMVYPRNERMHLPSDLAGVTAVTYESRSDGNLHAALGPVCTRIKQAMGVAKSPAA